MVGSIYVVASVFIKTFAQGMKGLKKKKMYLVVVQRFVCYVHYIYAIVTVGENG